MLDLLLYLITSHEFRLIPFTFDNQDSSLNKLFKIKVDKIGPPKLKPVPK